MPEPTSGKRPDPSRPKSSGTPPDGEPDSQPDSRPDSQPDAPSGTSTTQPEAETTPDPSDDAAPEDTREPVSTDADAHAGGAGDAGSGGAASRLWRALWRPSRTQVVVAVLLGIVGFAAAVEVRSNSEDDAYAGRRQEDLIDILNGLTGASDRAQREIDRLESTKADLSSDSSARGAALSQAEERSRNLSILAGLVPVQGPGIRITINETDRRVSTNAVLDTIQELRTADAEAMEFNNELRIVAQSSFESTEEGLMIDGVLLEPPYVLEVIGEPHTLRGALTFLFGPVTQLTEDDHAEVDIADVEQLQIRSVRDPVEPDLAEPGGS